MQLLLFNYHFGRYKLTSESAFAVIIFSLKNIHQTQRFLLGHRHTCPEAGKHGIMIFIANREENVEWLIQGHLSWELGSQFVGVRRVWIQWTCGIVQQKVAYIAACVQVPPDPFIVNTIMCVRLNAIHWLRRCEPYARQYITTAFHLTKLLRSFATIERYGLWWTLISTWITTRENFSGQ